ncbi:MAG: rod shape-determining protein MreC, partial [Alistipes sp.]|nr:rod shape-determining protein MreC [Alistipes sp.]
MYRLFLFIKRTYVILLFLLLEIAALNRYASSTAYTQAKILARTTAVTGAVNGAVTDVGHYFSLSSENAVLTERLAMAEARLAAVAESEQSTGALSADDLLPADSLSTDWAQYQFYAARVVSSSTDKPRNFVVLNRGLADGIREDMA